MSIDFFYELNKVQKELENLGEEVSDAVRHSLEDVLDWAKAGYQKQALREQLKAELQRAVPEQQSLLTHEWCQDSGLSVSQAKTNLKDAFTSHAGKKLQTDMGTLVTNVADSVEDMKTFKQSFKASNWI